MVHISFCFLNINSIKSLDIPHRAQGNIGEHLGLPALEQSRTMGSWKESHVGIQRADFHHPSSVYALALIKDQGSDHFLLKLVQCIGYFLLLLREGLGQFFLHRIANRVHVQIPDGFIVAHHGSLHVFPGYFINFIPYFIGNNTALILRLRFSNLFDNIVNKADDAFDFIMTLLDCIQHDLFCDLIGSCFDHDYLFHIS